ncbi:MAG TPA: hypothetical protein VIM62_06565 [Acidobacteriaceae bacterium]
MQDHTPILCPSSRCKDGAIVLGIVLANKTIAYADQRYRIDQAQAGAMQHADISPEKRFRFSSPCAQCGCGQWIPDGQRENDPSAGRCGVIESVLATPQPLGLCKELPSCSIRPQCRWYLQRGEEACSVCRYVITDTAVMTETEAEALLV